MFSKFKGQMRKRAPQKASKIKASLSGCFHYSSQKQDAYINNLRLVYKYSPSQLNHALELLKEGKTYRQVEELTGISKSTLIRGKKTACRSKEEGAFS
ncbi:MAG: hypothetical protein Q4E38_00650 [Eubacteriales bacterium]|nr:hypothetical protein [Eubacteriales bacterium]